MGPEFDAVAGALATLLLLLFAPGGGDGSALNGQSLLRAQAQTVIALARTAGELRYDAMAVDARTGAVIVDGLVFDGADGRFEVRSLRYAAEAGLDSLTLTVTFDDLSGAPTAFGDDAADILRQATPGLETVTLSGAVEARYDWADSALHVTLASEVDALGAVDASASLVDLWVSPDAPEPDRLRGFFDEGWVMITDDGLREGAERVSGLKVTAPTTAALVGQLVAAGLAEDARDWSSEPEVRAAIDAASAASVAFLTDGGRLMMTLRPDALVSLREIRRAAERTESTVYVISQLEPSFTSATAPRGGAAEPPAEGDVEGTLDYAYALREGNGAPRNLSRAAELLAPLAEAGELEAQTMLSETLSRRGLPGDAANAYAWALRAWALGPEAGDASDGDGASQALAARTSALSVSDQLAIEAAFADDPALLTEETAALIQAAEAGDAAAARRMAELRLSGFGAPRSLARAYRWALIAGGAGDRSGERIARDLEGRFAGAGGDDNAAWRAMLTEEADAALSLWGGVYAPQP